MSVLTIYPKLMRAVKKIYSHVTPVCCNKKSLPQTRQALNRTERNVALLISTLLQVADGEHVLVNLCETYTLAFLDADTAVDPLKIHHLRAANY